MSNHSVEVIEIRFSLSSKSLKAFADIRVNDWIIHDFRIIKQNGQKAFVSPPQSSWRDPGTGEIRFKGILTIPSEQKQLIDIAILSVYQKELEKKNGKQT